MVKYFSTLQIRFMQQDSEITKDGIGSAGRGGGGGGVVSSSALKAGWIVTFAGSLAFIVYGILDTLIPLWGEEPYDGMTYAQLQQTAPKLANLFWHDSVLYGSAIVAASVITAILSWRGIARGSKLAWGLVMVWAVALFVSGLVAHGAIGDTNLSHVGYATILLVVLFVGLALSSRPIFSSRSGYRWGDR
jgi:hypothetical protein